MLNLCQTESKAQHQNAIHHHSIAVTKFNTKEICICSIMDQLLLKCFGIWFMFVETESLCVKYDLDLIYSLS